MAGQRPAGYDGHYGVRVQSRMISHMQDLQLTPHDACDGKNKAPYKVSRTSLTRWKEWYDKWGMTPAYTLRHFGRIVRSGKHRAMLLSEVAALKNIVDADPFLFIDEMQERLEMVTGKLFTIPTIYRNLVTRPVKQGGIGYSLQQLWFVARQQSAEERRLYRAVMCQVLDPRQFLFIDETAVSADVTRRNRGYGRRGRRLS